MKKGKQVPLYLTILSLLLSIYIYAQTKESVDTLSSFTSPLASTNTLPDFDGTLLAVSDADMRADGYLTGKVGRPEGQRDALTIFPFHLGNKSLSGVKITASNSVTTWPKIVESSKNGKYVYIAEVRGEYAEGVSEIKNVYADTPAGKTITTIDVSNPAKPTTAHILDVGMNPRCLDVAEDDGFILSTIDEPDGKIVFIKLKQGLPESVFKIPLPEELNFEKTMVSDVAWHPDNQHIALILNNRKIAFLKVTYNLEGDPLSIGVFGNTLTDFNNNKTLLSAGEFSSNGNYFLVPDTSWGSTRADTLLDKNGQLISIKFDRNGNKHKIADIIEVGGSPEGFAISNDNKLIAVVNMEKTIFVESPFEKQVPLSKSEASSLSLLMFDDNAGLLTIVDQKQFRGVLPEDAVFDKDDDSLAVAIYHYRDFEREHGFVEFWGIDRTGKQPQLVRTGIGLPVTRGVHDLAVLKGGEVRRKK